VEPRATEPDGERQHPKITAELMSVLARVPGLFDQMNAMGRQAPAPGSEASRDSARPLGHHVAILATDHLSTGMEHLVAWRNLLVAGSQPYAAHMTLIRGAMEGAVTCRWLVDPRIDSAERIRRGIALLLDDYGNRRDFERDWGITAVEPPAKSAADRIATLRADRDRAKIGHLAVPGPTSLFGAYSGWSPARGRGAYRLLSAFAHGQQWKGLILRIDAVGADVPGGQVVRVSANDELAVAFTAFAVRVAGSALAELGSYVGRASEGARPDV